MSYIVWYHVETLMMIAWISLYWTVRFETLTWLYQCCSYQLTKPIVQIVQSVSNRDKLYDCNCPTDHFRFVKLFKIMQKHFLLLFIYIFGINLCDLCDAQAPRSSSNRINRMQGSIITNLTRTHAYDDDIVTSHLDASIRIRQFYRMFRDVYNKYE